MRHIGWAIVAIYLLLAASNARADREIWLGKDCFAAIESEGKRGSRMIGSEPREGVKTFTIQFLGKSNRKPASVVYFCADGVVASQAIGIEIETESEGRPIFSDWKHRLTASWGAPVEDSSDVVLSEVSEAIDIPLWRNAWWERGNQHVVVTFGGSLNGSFGISITATGPTSTKALTRKFNGDPDITTMLPSVPDCAEGWFYKYPDEEELAGHEGLLLGFNEDGQLCYFEEIEDQTNRIETPWLVESVELVYPTEGIVKGIEGEATFSFTIDKDGTVLEKSIIDSSDEMFSTAILVAFADFQVDPKAFDGEEFPYTHKVRFPFEIIQIEK